MIKPEATKSFTHFDVCSETDVAWRHLSRRTAPQSPNPPYSLLTPISLPPNLLTPTQPQREVEEHGPFPVNTTIEFSSVHINNMFCLVFKCASVTKLQLQMFEHSDAGRGGGGGLLRLKVQQYGPSFLGRGAL